MGDRAATPPVPGSLTGFVTPSVVALPVAYFVNATNLTRVTFRVNDPPSGGSVTVELNTASDGSGLDIEATIANGERFATATGSVAIAAGSYLYQRITAESGDAMNMSGEYEIESATGATLFLTSLAQVLLDLDESGVDANRDAIITQLIQGVSRQMQNYMGRQIVQIETTDEKIDSYGDVMIQTLHYPIISVGSLEENGEALVEDTDFELQPEDLSRGQIARISGDSVIAWLKGRRVVKITYTHGFASVPDDLVMAATAAVVWKYFDTVQSGKARRGMNMKGTDPTSSVTLDKDLWKREIVPVLNQYRGLVA